MISARVPWPLKPILLTVGQWTLRASAAAVSRRSNKPDSTLRFDPTSNEFRAVRPSEDTPLEPYELGKLHGVVFALPMVVGLDACVLILLMYPDPLAGGFDPWYEAVLLAGLFAAMLPAISVHHYKEHTDGVRVVEYQRRDDGTLTERVRDRRGQQTVGGG